MDAPTIPEPDDKDWTWVLLRRCPECGFDAQAVSRDELTARTLAAVATVREALAADDAGQRPTPTVWSPLEYACHVRDVCVLFQSRLELMLTEDDPVFANWDQDETAQRDRYWEQVPAIVSAQLDLAAHQMATAIDAIGGDDWPRPGRRTNGSVFTVDTFTRYFLHDVVHHAHDVGPPAARAASS
jgi:DinB family protein